MNSVYFPNLLLNAFASKSPRLVFSLKDIPQAIGTCCSPKITHSFDFYLLSYPALPALESISLINHVHKNTHLKICTQMNLT